MVKGKSSSKPKKVPQKDGARNLAQTTPSNLDVFFNTIDDFFWVLDMKGHIVMVNDTVMKRLGYAREELIGKSVLMVHPTERHIEAMEILKAMIEGKASHCPIPLIAKDGTQIPVETRIAPGKWNNQDVFFGASRDISQTKLQEEQFSKAFQACGAPMVLAACETGSFMDVNSAFLSALGYTREEVIGKTVTELGLFVDPPQRDIMRKEITEKGTIRNVEAKIRAKDGRELVGMLSAQLIYIQHTPHFLITANDITELKQTEKTLNEHRRLLEEKIRERTAELRRNKSDLEEKSKGLEEANAALRVLLQHRDKDREELERRFAINITKLILPYIKKFKKGHLDGQQRSYVDILEANLKEIASPFLRSLQGLGLTAKEIQVASLIREGKTTKEITEILAVASSSIDSHRSSIRAKLGLSNKRVNLHSYLQSVE